MYRFLMNVIFNDFQKAVLRLIQESLNITDMKKPPGFATRCSPKRFFRILIRSYDKAFLRAAIRSSALIDAEEFPSFILSSSGI